MSFIHENAIEFVVGKIVAILSRSQCVRTWVDYVF